MLHSDTHAPSRIVEATAVGSAPSCSRASSPIPYTFQINDGGRIDTNDGRWSIWVVSWVAHALSSDPLSCSAPTSSIRTTTALAFSEGNIVEGVIGAPVWALTKNPYTTHNFVFLFAFAQSFVATYYLVRRLTGDRRPQRSAGVMFVYLPVRVRPPGPHPAADDRLPAVVHARVAPLPRSHRRSRARSSSAS